MMTTTTIKRIQNFDDLTSAADEGLAWPHLFVHPDWLETWWRIFTPDAERCLLAVEQEGQAIGVAPLMIHNRVASFIGDPEICDYFDFIVRSGFESQFFSALLDDLSDRNVMTLDLRSLRPESTVPAVLTDLAKKRGARVIPEQDGSSMEMKLPTDWNDYLESLPGKQRHEIRRKFRRLEEAASICFEVIQDPAAVADRMDAFLTLFRESRADKAFFMNPRMERFFRSMFLSMADRGFLKLFLLNLDDEPAAGAVCFDYRGTLYLYNSGYSPAFMPLSAGLLCKVSSIRYAIESGRRKYDFLKGIEPYKHRLGGSEVPLIRCRIEL
jgi:CelD/BcsL family acetyltransferase involved in cellulose biosynthesis